MVEAVWYVGNSSTGIGGVDYDGTGSNALDLTQQIPSAGESFLARAWITY
jgi:hypothetical protein